MWIKSSGGDIDASDTDIADAVFYINKSIMALIKIISASSKIVSVLIGRLNTEPRQAHLIACLFNTLLWTPAILKDNTASVTQLEITGRKLTANAMPRTSSRTAYT